MSISTERGNASIEAHVTFNLVDQPWIPVIDLRGRATKVSLRDVLVWAHEFRWLNGESASVTASLHRLVLAVLHRCLGFPERPGGPATDGEWAALWRDRLLPEEKIHEYFAKLGSRFDLFDERHPFLQCPALGSLPMGSPAQLVHYRSVGNNATLFDQTTANDGSTLDPAEAARWLVTVQAFDTGGLKTPFRKAKSSQRSLCNNYGTVVVEGSTLKETLLLNLPVYAPEIGSPRGTTPADRPAWEAEPPDPEPKTRNPMGWLDLLTWPARRVLLRGSASADGPRVTGTVITPGTQLNAELSDVELMAGFHRERPKSKKAKWPPWSAVRLHELRGVWRHARDMLLRGEAYVQRRPHMLDHIAKQVERQVLPNNAVYTIRVFGQQLDDSGGGSVQTWLEETLPAPVALLRAEDATLGVVIGFCVQLAASIGNDAKAMLRHYRAAFHAEHSAKEIRNAAHNYGLEQRYWPRLPAPFAEFLRVLADATTTSAKESAAEQWKREVRSAAQQAVNDWSRQALVVHARHRDVLAEHLAWFDSRLEYHCRLFDNGIAGSLLPDGEE